MSDTMVEDAFRFRLEPELCQLIMERRAAADDCEDEPPTGYAMRKGWLALVTARRHADEFNIEWRSPAVRVTPAGHIVLDWRSDGPWLTIIATDTSDRIFVINSPDGDEPTRFDMNPRDVGPIVGDYLERIEP